MTRFFWAWEVFLLLQGLLRQRFEIFARGDWESLLVEMPGESRGSQASGRRRRREQDDDVLGGRGGTFEMCVQTGKLSSARQCLEGDPVAQGTEPHCSLFETRRKVFSSSAGVSSRVRCGLEKHSWCECGVVGGDNLRPFKTQPLWGGWRVRQG